MIMWWLMFVFGFADLIVEFLFLPFVIAVCCSTLCFCFSSVVTSTLDFFYFVGTGSIICVAEE